MTKLFRYANLTYRPLTMEIRMETEKQPHILQHVQTGKYLELWIDGWYLIKNPDEATTLNNLEETHTSTLPELERLFGPLAIQPKFNQNAQCA